VAAFNVMGPSASAASHRHSSREAGIFRESRVRDERGRGEYERGEHARGQGENQATGAECAIPSLLPRVRVCAFCGWNDNKISSLSDDRRFIDPFPPLRGRDRVGLLRGRRPYWSPSRRSSAGREGDKSVFLPLPFSSRLPPEHRILATQGALIALTSSLGIRYPLEQEAPTRGWGCKWITSEYFGQFPCISRRPHPVQSLGSRAAGGGARREVNGGQGKAGCALTQLCSWHGRRRRRTEKGASFQEALPQHPLSLSRPPIASLLFPSPSFIRALCLPRPLFLGSGRRPVSGGEKCTRRGGKTFAEALQKLIGGREGDMKRERGAL